MLVREERERKEGGTDSLNVMRLEDAGKFGLLLKNCQDGKPLAFMRRLNATGKSQYLWKHQRDPVKGFISNREEKQNM